MKRVPVVAPSVARQAFEQLKRCAGAVGAPETLLLGSGAHMVADGRQIPCYQIHGECDEADPQSKPSEGWPVKLRQVLAREHVARQKGEVGKEVPVLEDG